MSMLATSVVFVFVTIYGIFAVIFLAEAQQAGFSIEAVGVSAAVMVVTPGPMVVDSISQAHKRHEVFPVQPTTPELDPFAASGAHKSSVILKIGNGARVKNVILGNGVTERLPVFETQNPTFLGTSDIPNAIVIISIHSSQVIQATTYADSSGSWSWQSGEAVLPGVHTINLTVQDPNDPLIFAKESLRFYINPAAVAKPTPHYLQNPKFIPSLASNNLFDVIVKIPQQFQTVSPGDELVASIKLINFGSAGNPVDVIVQYIVEDSTGKIIMQSSQTMAVATQLSVLKTFYINPDLPEGTYKFTARVPSKDIIATSADSFTVKGGVFLPLSSDGKVSYMIFFQALMALLFLFSLVLYFEYNKVSILSQIIKKVDEQDLLLYNNQ